MIWALVAAAAVFWGMRLVAKGEPVPSHAVVVSESTNVRGDFSRLLGAEPVATVAAPPAASTRFKLLGVMAAKAGPQGTVTPGVALISIDGKPARAFTSGAQIEDRLVLQNVSMRSASIGAPQGPVAFVLEVPPLPAPATGTLPRFTPDVPQPSAPQAPAFNPPPVPATSQRPVPPAGNGAAPPGPRNVLPGARQARPGVGNPEASR